MKRDSTTHKPHPRTLMEIALQTVDEKTGWASCSCHENDEDGRWWLCPYHVGVDEGWDERQEVIEDLKTRIDRAVEELGSQKKSARITGKAEGLELVKEWLGSYE